MRSIRIGILGSRGIPNQYGGFEQLAEYLSAGLAKKNHEVSVYNPQHHTYKEKEWNGVQIIHCRDSPISGTWGQFLYDLHCINDARKRDFDILLHLGYTSDSVWHRRWPKKMMHLVNMDGLEWKRTKYNWLTRRFLLHAESLAANHAGLLIADSPVIKDHLASKYNKRIVYIPYGAVPFNEPDPSRLQPFGIQPSAYSILIARMEPENNIEPIIRGYLASSLTDPLLVVGNPKNKYGRRLSRHFRNERIHFTGGIFDTAVLNNLRFHAAYYFHGHSAGGTNPSLLEAMACGCNIIAHDNPFNRHILQAQAVYFSKAEDITALLNKTEDRQVKELNRSLNLEKIRNTFNWPSVIDHYEAAMLEALNSPG
ncbi:MAG TPA: DUF1972 domain-containing protein [Chitinophagaceae bacterium]|nr:DUF1972 domain-containing protein [Chitinophagaceae bacterium]